MTDIHICLATDNNYAKYCATVILSALKNKKEEENLVFHIIHSENLSAENIKKMRQICDMKFYFVDNSLFAPYFKNANNLWSVETLYRLKIASILKDLDKVIYLDCDTLVRKPLSELWTQDIENYALAAVKDNGYTAHLKRNNISFEYFYFNAGVLLINLKKIRQNNTEKKLFENLIQNFKEAIFGDQDVLNCVLHKETKEISNNFNFLIPNITSAKTDLKTDPLIVHFAGMKPWEKSFKNKFRDEFWKYFEMCPLIDKPYFKEKHAIYEKNKAKIPQVLMYLKLYPFPFLSASKMQDFTNILFK